MQWGGDSYSSLDQLAGQLRGLLSYGLSGVPFCSFDIGGFDYAPQAFYTEDLDSFPKDPVVYLRSLQFAVFTSHMRAHGKQPREPWTYGEQVLEIARRYLELRYRLLPYIYAQAEAATQTGLPMVRAMVLEFQQDRSTHDLDQQYMFGDSFLVAPILTEDGSYEAYLPAGTWFDFWTEEAAPGNRWIHGRAELDELPVWVRAGAVIPLSAACHSTRAWDPAGLTLQIYGTPPSGTVQLQLGPDTELQYTIEHHPDRFSLHFTELRTHLALKLVGTVYQPDVSTASARPQFHSEHIITIPAGSTGPFVFRSLPIR